ncbi:efflux RND transporter periplasmic adaptor subunit [Alteromonas sediminis]|uniref:Efflux RND transporter periplasmic adaptor subunit n=1 Tax=Alteromonas sediminis TaxID=2259342 RepID=A0A3N5Y5T1_9ALTE|nr:efflux RND transporter periplasmic adaptor subunit [Alteromonas sediminis]RPJ68623.1 efflux RND transporter periplasmic adaptor subunit [Alteromonas sediminis]
MSNQFGPQSADQASEVYEKSAPWLVHTFVSIGILLIGIAVVMALFGSKPEAGRRGERPAPSVAVEIAPLQKRSYEVWVDSYGTAEALTETALVAEVTGRVISVSPNIRAGRQFKEGDVLVELDDSNYQIEVDVAASAAADAEVAYLQEVAQAEFAAEEWNELPKSEAAKRLALREPQVAAAKAALQAAKSRLERAKLDLARTKITAPFDGKVMSQSIDIGQVVSPGQAIANIYSTDTVEVRLPLKISDLAHLKLPEAEVAPDQLPQVILETDMGSKTYQWQAQIVRTEGAFDPNTRMLYAVAQVIEPFESNAQRPAIRLGQFLRAKVQGNLYSDVFVIPRRAVSQNFMVSVAEDGVLRKKTIEPLWTDVESVVVAATDMAISTDDKLILTPTANLPDGTKVKPLGLDSGSDRRENREAIIADASGADSSAQAN